MLSNELWGKVRRNCFGEVFANFLVGPVHNLFVGLAFECVEGKSEMIPC